MMVQGGRTRLVNPPGPPHIIPPRSPLVTVTNHKLSSARVEFLCFFNEKVVMQGKTLGRGDCFFFDKQKSNTISSHIT